MDKDEASIHRIKRMIQDNDTTIQSIRINKFIVMSPFLTTEGIEVFQRNSSFCKETIEREISGKKIEKTLKKSDSKYEDISKKTFSSKH